MQKENIRAYEISTRSRTLYGAPEGHDARILASRARALMPDDRVLVHIALDEARAFLLEELLAFFAPDVDAIVLPPWDCLPYDRVSPSNDVVARRVASLARLTAWQAEQKRTPRVLITTVNAALQRAMPQNIIGAAHMDLKTGGMLNLAALQTFLAANGFSRIETVREPGDYALRGGLIDVFPPGFDNPVRLDLFGDTIESIRLFSADTQLSLKPLEALSLAPASEFFLSQDAVARFRARYREIFGAVREDDPLYEAVSEGRRYNGMDHWLPLFHEKLETVFDYAPRRNVTLDHHALEAAVERQSQIKDFYQAREDMKRAHRLKSGAVAGTVYHALPPEMLYLDETEWQTMIGLSPPESACADSSPPLAGGRGGEYAVLSPFGVPPERADHDGGGRKGRDFADIRAQKQGDVLSALRDYMTALQKSPSLREGLGEGVRSEFIEHRNPSPQPSPIGRGSFKILIACYSEGSRERLRGMMDAAGIANIKLVDKAENLKKLQTYETGLCLLSLEHGFVANDLAVITEQDILGDRLIRKAGRRKKSEQFLTEISTLAEGDLVVHVDHGIGRFIALETVAVDKTLHDCLKIEYAGGDKLFVPVENMDVLSRFGPDESESAQLDKLGGAGWQARKAKVKKNLMLIADHLLKIAAARKLNHADSFQLDAGIYNEFVAKFPYQETEDQDRAIADVVGDLGKDYPMDRLVCGDVGFGKTEVALRAAYIAAMEGAQVAVAVPTTLLARQHFQNFQQRFAGTGLRVAQLSRLVGAKDTKAVQEGLRDGTVNIVIGTHALFGKTVKFSNLGLLIVDEEQRFGVKQKERLKELKSSVHVLTLTATPIPRTLQMALSGVRELSLIATPPVDRLAVRTFVMPFDPVVIREAILREHYRGGQSFFVCPRVKDIEDMQRVIADLVPEVKIITAHGQLPPAELEARMGAFCDREYDVLLATNIIESGIDIATANTMIIHRADMFGLSQLYQLRGRIGRSKMRAYAYLTYAPAVKLNPQAMKRLEVMETLDTLGSGFQLASHDMDIRGAGNLLGDQQSGHIREIGVELYQQMLEEAVAAARDGAGGETEPRESWSPQINIGTSVLIPESYIEDLNIRMSLYRRLSGLETKADIESFAAELIDRFGPLPAEVENLLDIVSIKQICRSAGIAQVEAGPKGAVIAFHKAHPPDVQKLLAWIAGKGGAVKLRPDQKLSVIREWPGESLRARGVKALAAELAGL